MAATTMVRRDLGNHLAGLMSLSFANVHATDGPALLPTCEMRLKLREGGQQGVHLCQPKQITIQWESLSAEANMPVAEAESTNPIRARRPAVYPDTSIKGDSSTLFVCLRSHIRETPYSIVGKKESLCTPKHFHNELLCSADVLST